MDSATTTILATLPKNRSESVIVSLYERQLDIWAKAQWPWAKAAPP